MSSFEVSADAFLRLVLRSKLLSRDELLQALRDVPRDHRDDPRALANHLIHKGRLTRFQAGKLLRGVAHGMALGPFRVLAPLGKGGMGTVFLVRDTRDAALAALKVLPPRLAKEPRMLARFQREMEMCRKVSHRHLARAHEVGEYRGVYFIAMEYIPGRTLSRLVNEEGTLPVPRAARLFAEVAAALHHAHGQGVIHRDLKPSNILVTPYDEAKVVDLGLALMHGEVVDDAAIVGGKGYIVGTMDYIAPEQTHDAASVGPRSDLYSLGCALYFTLVGHPPFPGGTSKEKVRRHRGEEPAALLSLRPGLPPGFVDLVERLMAKDPEGRPANAAEVEAELAAWSTGADTRAADSLEELGVEGQLYTTAPGSTEYSLVSLPAVEVLDDAPEPPRPFPLWLLLLLGASSLVMLVGAITALVYMRS